MGVAGHEDALYDDFGVWGPQAAAECGPSTRAETREGRMGADMSYVEASGGEADG